MGEEDPGRPRAARASPRWRAPTRWTSCGTSRRHSARLQDRVRGRLGAAADPGPAAREAQGHRRLRADRGAGPHRPHDAARPRPAARPRCETLQRRFDHGRRRGAARATPSASSPALAEDIGRLRHQAPPDRPRRGQRRARPCCSGRSTATSCTSFQRLQSNLNPRTIGLADVPPEIKRKFISDSGRFLMQIHPAVEHLGPRRAPSASSPISARWTPTSPARRSSPTRRSVLMERAYKQGTLYAIVVVARADLPDAAPRARDAAGAAAAGPGPDVDGRPDARLRSQVQPRQRLRACR